MPPSVPEVVPQDRPLPPGDPGCPVATLGDRCIAIVLDSAVLCALFAVVDAWAFFRWSVPATSGWNITGASVLISVVLDIGIFFVYLWLLEAAFGATVGKAMVGIRVLGNDGRSALAASAIRNLLRVVDGLGFYLVGFMVASCSRMRQRIGDLCAGTVVVAPAVNGWTKALASFLWVAVLVGAGWGLPRIHADSGAHRIPYLRRVVVQMGDTDNSAYLRVANFKIEVQRNAAQPAPLNEGSSHANSSFPANTPSGAKAQIVDERRSGTAEAVP